MPSQRLLLVDGVPAEVGGRAYDVLLALAERRDRIVRKEELLAIVWPDTVVEEGNVTVHISALRKLLGSRAITTVQRVGYRLTAEPESAEVASPRADAWKPASGEDGTQPHLFGREEDSAALLEVVGVRPLVSITGSGGVGKTSLARHLVARRANAAGKVAHWIDLTLLRPADSLSAAVAAQIGVFGTTGDSPADLLAALSRTRALITLDNCEHMAAQVAELVGAALEVAPDVSWIVTSQVPLHVPQEHVYQLGPLDVPARGTPFPEAVRAGSVALLRARAAATYRPFELTAANVDAAIDICRDLDGLPLAIEMAASLIATLGLETVREQLNEKLRLSNRDPGVPERQRTLRCTLDWSYGLLTAAQQRLFRHLHPFVGGFTARMARQMVSDDPESADGPQSWEALEALSALVERSLVHRARDGNRLFLFESARDYALERQGEAGESDRIRRRHAEIVALWFTTARGDHDRMRDVEWSPRYVVERHNVRAALAWACVSDEPDLLARMVAALAEIDTFSRAQAEVVHCNVPMDTLLKASPRWRAAACVELSWAHFLDGDRKAGTALARQAVEDFRAVGDTAGVYQSLAQLIRLYESRPGLMAKAMEAAAAISEIDEERVPLRSRLFRAITAGLQYAGDRTVERLQELHDLAIRSGYDTLAAVCRVHITDQLLIDGRFEDMVEAARRFEAATETRPRVRATILANLVLALIHLGRTAEASEPAKVVLRTLPSATFHVVAAFALAAVRRGRLEEAALMIGYCDRVRQERDQRADPAEAIAETEIAETLSRGLPASRLAELHRLGRALSMQEAWSFIP